jgi:hypothetical protein
MPHFKISINGASMIFSLACWAIRPPIDCKMSSRNFRPPLFAKQDMVLSLHHLGNERHWSVNDFRSHIFDNLGGNSLQTVRNEVLTAFIGKRESKMLPAPSRKCVSADRQ